MNPFIELWRVSNGWKTALAFTVLAVGFWLQYFGHLTPTIEQVLGGIGTVLGVVGVTHKMVKAAD